MSTFEDLSKKLDSFHGGDKELHELHALLWETGMLLSGEQFHIIVNRLKNIHPESEWSKCWSLLSEGTLFSFHPDFGNSFEKLSEAKEAFEKMNDRSGKGAAQALMVLFYKNSGRLDEAQECVQDAIANINENRSYIQFLCIAYYQAGEINHILKDYKTAIGYYKEGLTHVKEDTAIGTRLLIGLANGYKDSSEQDLALDLFQKALKQIEGKDNYILESKIYADIANYYFRKLDFESSVSFHEKSIRIRTKCQMKNALITNYMELAEICLKKCKPEEAMKYASLAEELSKELNIVIKLNQVYLIISSIYEAMGNLSKALDYFKNYHATKEEVFSQESARKIKQLSLRHEMETMQQEKELFRLRNVVLKEALEEIGSSVRYAKRIQEAILPPTNTIKEKFPRTFVLYKPKDIVAGDFYWMEEINGTVLIAVADCTGHGVPGAMVSVVCSNALNRAVKEFHLSDTGSILDKVTDLVLETFEKSVADVMDGMDISLLSINKVTGTVQWSGANNPLWYFENTELKEITADKQPIGKSDHRKPFTTHTIKYTPGTTLYLFTDGYADQFGGPNGKKFKYKPLQDTLSKLLEKDPDVQLNSLNEIFDDWKGSLEQVDDVCMIGIRL
ncbi:MAG: protein serine/threonine phosphatase [Bacteroidetes bacterium]|jgi:serine phosphatase RsbU (regulator of sigma subunit)|nr:protein serine/threonine phosphatase [Bacteroidota bacterium]MDF2453304.1 protein serine/threonine phosphatase [Bacteroidota bacterium]